jgi:hypothetical protein
MFEKSSLNASREAFVKDSCGFRFDNVDEIVFHVNSIFRLIMVETLDYDKQKSLSIRKGFFAVGGPDETRTRDPMRDRHVF